MEDSRVKLRLIVVRLPVRLSLQFGYVRFCPGSVMDYSAREGPLLAGNRKVLRRSQPVASP